MLGRCDWKWHTPGTGVPRTGLLYSLDHHNGMRCLRIETQSVSNFTFNPRLSYTAVPGGDEPPSGEVCECDSLTDCICWWMWVFFIHYPMAPSNTKKMVLTFKCCIPFVKFANLLQLIGLPNWLNSLGANLEGGQFGQMGF